MTTTAKIETLASEIQARACDIGRTANVLHRLADDWRQLQSLITSMENDIADIQIRCPMSDSEKMHEAIQDIMTFLTLHAMQFPQNRRQR